MPQTEDEDDPGGRLPITPEAASFYLAACDALQSLSEGRAPTQDDLHHISEAKGMFGRLFILGQRDRIAVSTALGDPPKQVAQACRAWLVRLRAAVKNGENIAPFFTEPAAYETLDALSLARKNLARQGFEPAPDHSVAEWQNCATKKT